MNDYEKIEFKKLLKEKAYEILQKRISSSSAAMLEAQRAANEEDKSSVGDKYETARAMAQIDRDIHAKQLESAQKELSFLQQTDVSLFCKKVDTGAFAEADNGKYFFLTGIGPVDINNEKIFFLSIHSPIGKKFEGKKAGELVNFNGRNIHIKEVF